MKNPLDKISKILVSLSSGGNELILYANAVCTKISQHLGETVSLEFDPNNVCTSGRSNTHFDGFERKLILGSKNLLGISTGSPEFTYAMITVNHEAQHYSQLIDIKNGRADEHLLYCHFAEQDKLFYTSNYTLSYREYDAEHIGIVETYKYMQEKHPEADVLSHIKSYMLHRNGMYEKFKTQIEKMSSLNDLEILFLDIYDRLTVTKKDANYSDVNNISDVAALMSSFRSSGNIIDQNLNLSISTLYAESCRDNLDSDQFASFAVMQKHPECLKRYPEAYKPFFEKLTMDYFISKAKKNMSVQNDVLNIMNNDEYERE